MTREVALAVLRLLALRRESAIKAALAAAMGAALAPRRARQGGPVREGEEHNR